MGSAEFSRVLIRKTWRADKSVKTHSLDCRWHGIRLRPEMYEEVDAEDVASYSACSLCGGGKAVTPPLPALQPR
jgi:hypothetical protein